MQASLARQLVSCADRLWEESCTDCISENMGNRKRILRVNFGWGI